ncbi:MAG: TetM/TetW/TetO/TetS family tetracycline resistance ribosomal protection protein [Lachnospiraceae bacterium]|nr:TetM/TetW/TetO/TetS family tetracycline resistance ribosomal protection protein [Lachnospiraceae bacterium]
MGNQAEKTEKRRVCAGLLAHVDAGKTTLAEGILYLIGRIRSLGRVDHQDAFFDNFAMERERGITIFSKQAQVTLEDKAFCEEAGVSSVSMHSAREGAAGRLGSTLEKGQKGAESRKGQSLSLTLLDTPGHVDFSAEMERTLQILDYAILVISGADGVQSHVETLWRLLERYRIPVFLFVNKMDQPGTDRAALLAELKQRLDERCQDFTLPHDSEEFQENLAMCGDELLESYLSGEPIGADTIGELIAAREVFPCYFGSALRLQGVEELLEGIRTYSIAQEYPREFGARVYKISRDAQGNRLTHMKITGGTLCVKDVLTNQKCSGDVKASQGAAATGDSARDAGDKIWEEKVNQIRIFSGAAYETVTEVKAGTVCAVTGLDHTFAGEGLGIEPEGELPVLEPVLSYRVELPEGTDVHRAFRQLKQLEEEEPQLHITWTAGQIHAQLMGEVQTEVLQSMIRERFGLNVKFGEGSIVYRETIAEPVVGMGHFEPLRHYAEVHLLLEPAERGSGLQFETACSTDELDGNWQRLILTHLEEKSHPGVLTGSDITDMKITLVAGRAHQKHTEGGDFRQATYRAVRQGLCRARSVLLEPVYSFRMEVPSEAVGRAIADIQRMYGTSEPPVPIRSGGGYQSPAGSAAREISENSGNQNIVEDRMLLEGTAPVVTMRGYQSELLSYTKGRGRLICRLKGYEECHNAQEVIEARAYDAQADLENPCGSVFCAHGAGFAVDWEHVPDYVHIPGTDAYVENAFAGNHPVAESGEQGDGETHSAPPGSTDIPPAERGCHPAAGRAGQSENAARWSGSMETPPRSRSAAGRAGQSENAVRWSGSMETPPRSRSAAGRAGQSENAARWSGSDEELQAIFERTYGPVKRERNRFLYSKGKKQQDSGWAGYEAPASRRSGSMETPSRSRSTAGRAGQWENAARWSGSEECECLLVDGYNIIFAWDELKELAKENLESARGRLLDLMSNYQGYKQNHLIVVFDAYRVAGHRTETFRYHNIYVVYTKEAETADQYIEKTVREINRNYHVTVATSDALEQVIIFGAGASRLSARGLFEELEQMQKDLHENYLNVPQKGGKTYLLDGQEGIEPALKHEFRDPDT